MANHGVKARYVGSIIAAPVGSATLPQGSLYAAASTGFALIEAGWFGNSTTGGKRVQLNRLTTLGTPGAVQTAGKFDDDAPAAVCQVRDTHTVGPTLGDRLHQVPSLNAAQQGLWYGWHDDPLEVASGTGNGIGFLPTVAAGNTDVTFVWEE